MTGCRARMQSLVRAAQRHALWLAPCLALGLSQWPGQGHAQAADHAAPALAATPPATPPPAATDRSAAPQAPGEAPGAAAAPEADPLARGQQVYEAHCYFCHGYRGDGRTQAARTLDPPPRDFRRGPPLEAAAIAATVAQGRPGTAMASYAGRLSGADIAAVATYVERRFVRGDGGQARYHSVANGWPDHERHAEAFPFALGELPADAPAEGLTAAQRRGQVLFRAACISCHDGRGSEQLQWTSRPSSYPRPPEGAGVPAPAPHAGALAADAPRVDAVSGASVYRRHEQAPKLRQATAQERRGERLYQAHCAFCHAPDGSGQHWIGRFMEPPARDLHTLDARALAALPQTIRDGLPGRAMPAWRAVLSRREIEAVAAYVRKAFAPR